MVLCEDRMMADPLPDPPVDYTNCEIRNSVLRQMVALDMTVKSIIRR
jgi:hypothetical protein